MKGISVECDLNAQHFPSAYKYTPYSTIFSAIYTTDWFITDISREPAWNRKNSFKVKLTGEAEKAIIERMTDF